MDTWPAYLYHSNIQEQTFSVDTGRFRSLVVEYWTYDLKVGGSSLIGPVTVYLDHYWVSKAMHGVCCPVYEKLPAHKGPHLVS